MLSDFRLIVAWWFLVFLFSPSAWPLTFHFFSRFWDRDYAFAKIISLVLVTYLVFVAGVLKLLPFTSQNIIIIALLLFWVSRHFYPLPRFKKNWPAFIAEELLFFFLLTAWAYVRGFNPDIEGLEKFMDWGFINSMLRGHYFPPADIWFAGSPINYYYFGHLIYALLTKVSGISSAITYNLSLATVCALTFTAAFSLVSNLIFSSLFRPSSRVFIIGGLISALILTFGGNLHWLYKITKTSLINRQNFLTAASLYWYPDATRFIGFDPDVKDKTIHEFPLYSFVVADLHGHLNDIPVILFFLAFLFAVYLSRRQPKTPRGLLDWPLIVPSALTLSVAYMTNAWDLAVYGLFFGISFLLTNHFNFSKTFKNGIFVILLWYLFTLPYSVNFIPMIQGLRLADSRTPLYQLFILYGGFWLLCLPFFLVFIKYFKFKINTSDVFVLSLITTATVLIIIPELVYVKDIYIFEHRRANTMFKLVYQAFIIYSLSVGYILVRLKKFLLYKLIFLLVFAVHLTYPFFAIRSYYTGFGRYQGLWGLNFLKNHYPDNLAAINWLNSHVSGQPTILEAAGDSYTTFNQISVATGLPTVEGWLVHEWLWRGGYDQPGARAADVEQIYQSKNLALVRQLLQKYHVAYVIVGDKEREKYSHLRESTFPALGAQLVFASGETKIYKL